MWSISIYDLNINCFLLPTIPKKPHRDRNRQILDKRKLSEETSYNSIFEIIPKLKIFDTFYVNSVCYGVFHINQVMTLSKIKQKWSVWYQIILFKNENLLALKMTKNSRYFVIKIDKLGRQVLLEHAKLGLFRRGLVKNWVFFSM